MTDDTNPEAAAIDGQRIDWQRIDGLPAVTVAESDIDRLELALGAGLTLGVATDAELASAAAQATGSFVARDRQRTPLAVLEATRIGFPHALRSRQRGNTAQWDPALRRSASDVRKAVEAETSTAGGESDAAGGGRRVLAVPFETLPSRADIERVSTHLAAGEYSTVLWVALVGGAGPADGAPSAAALTRAVAATASELGDRWAVISLAVPWGRRMPGILRLPFEGAASDSATDSATATLHSVLGLYGAHEVFDVEQHRSTDDAAELRQAELELSHAIAHAYPEASARELGGPVADASGAAGRGTVVLFTGLSGSGKSTLAGAVADELRERGERVAVLDGDDIREQLSAGLGFDRASRSMNVRRIGYVAALIAAQGSIAIAAPIAPFADDRADVRSRAEQVGSFVLVHVSTPLEVCEARDRKGLYARARAGSIPEFTGISSPYEPPTDADIAIDTSTTALPDAVAAVVALLS